MTGQIVIVEEERVRIVEVSPQGIPGPQGPPGESGGDSGRVTQIFSAGNDISGHRVVSADSGVVRYASADKADTAYRIVGISTHAAATGGNIQILSAGPIEDVSFDFQPSLPIWLGLDGRLTQVFDLAWAYRVIIGYPTGTRSMIVRFGEPTLL